MNPGTTYLPLNLYLPTAHATFPLKKPKFKRKTPNQKKPPTPAIKKRKRKKKIKREKEESCHGISNVVC